MIPGVIATIGAFACFVIVLELCVSHRTWRRLDRVLEMLEERSKQ
jgi:hypothetical protein